MRQIFHRSILLLVAFFGLVQGPAAFAWDDDRILQTGVAAMPALQGTPIDRVRVAVVRNGVLVPVPFQIDEYNTSGLVWFAETRVPLKGTAGVFDGDDRLLMLAGDLSAETMPATLAPPPGYFGQLAVSVQGETRYAQLIIGDFPRSNTSYVKHDLESGITETPFYTLRVDPANELNWQYLMVRSWQGDKGQSLVDTLKMRISGGVFTPVTRLTLDNENLRPKLVGYRSGPIRSTMQLDTAVVVGGVTVMKMQVQVVRYPRYFQAFTHARISRLYRMALVNPEVRVSIDGNNQRGAIVRTARGAELKGTVDSYLDDSEKAMLQRGLSSDDDWILFDSRRGFAIMTFLDVPPELRGIPLELVYEDNAKKTDKPERVPGQSPNLGYGLRGFPPGEDFHFGVTLSFDKDLGNVDPLVYVSRWREQPVYRLDAAARR